MILLKESDRPKSLREKIAEYVARPPQPILRFYGEPRLEAGDGKRYLHFAVRNGLPIPLLYGIYAKAGYDLYKVVYGEYDEYSEKTDHIGPFSVDDWTLTLDNLNPAELEIRVGVLPFEILTDRLKLVVNSQLLTF